MEPITTPIEIRDAGIWPAPIIVGDPHSSGARALTVDQADELAEDLANAAHVARAAMNGDT